MTGFFKNPLKSMFSAVLRSAPDNWFLRGDDAGPYRSQRTKISDPWAQSTWIFAALRLIAQPIAAAPVRFADTVSGEALDEAELWRFWSAPARGSVEPLSMSRLIEDSVAVRGVAGGVFWILDDTWLMRTASLRSPILVAAPCQMTPLWDGARLDGWVYRAARGRTMTLAPEQAIHLRMPNPGDPDSLDGIAPWMPARESAEAARASAKFARRIMDQNGDRGAFLIAKHALTEAQKEMLRAEMAEKRRAADRGEYRDSVIGGDIEIHQNAVAAVSAQFIGQGAMSRDEVFVAYGVPPSMGAVAASYSVGAASDWYRLITGTCAAEASDLATAIARVSDYVLGYRDLAAEIAGRASGGRGEERRVAAEFDFSAHPVMAEVRASRVEQMERLFKMGTPISVANDFLALGMPEYPGWDERWLPVSLAPASVSLPGSPEEDDAASRSRSGSVSAGWDEVARLVSARATRAAGESVRRQSAARLERWRRVDSARSADRDRLRNVVSRHFMAARAETLKNLKKELAGKSFATASEYEVRAGVLGIAFDLDRWFSGFWGDLGRMLGGIFRGAADAAADELDELPGDYDPLTETDPRVVEHLQERENLIKDASQDLHDELTASLEEGLQAGETLDELSERVREVFRGADKSRALTIARTETGAAYETARYATFKAAGIAQKGWLSGGEDGVTRATHQAADGQVRGIDDFFEVGAAKLLHPHDQVNGSDYPEEMINCRCVLTAEG